MNMDGVKIEENKAEKIVDKFLNIFKSDFGNKIDPLMVPNMDSIKFEEWGLR